MFTGTMTALVTPMRDGSIDLAALREFVEWQIASGIDGLVPCGTTGETATLSPTEQSQIIRAVVEQAAGRVPVVAGAGANATAKAIEASRRAIDAGADGLLHVTPYYNKPTQAGLVAHFRAIVEAVDRPIVLYNVPGRTSCDLLPETVAQLAGSSRIVGIKEATGSVIRGQQVIAACGDQLAVLSGDDFTALALTLLGGQGVISVVSNLAPKAFSQMVRAARQGNVAAARETHYELLPLIEQLFVESNPIPVKAGVSSLGFGQSQMRLPLQPLQGQALQRLLETMQRIGISK